MRNIAAVRMKFQPVLTGQVSNKLLIGVGFGSAQLVIKMNYRYHNAEFFTQLKQQAQKRDRINPARNRHADSISSPQQLLSADMICQAL
jgi:hypothetical protein